MRDSNTFQDLVNVASLQQGPPFKSAPPKPYGLTSIYIAPCRASASFNGSELAAKVAGRESNSDLCQIHGKNSSDGIRVKRTEIMNALSASAFSASIY